MLSTITVHRRLHKIGIKGLRVRKKPPLTRVQKMCRLAWMKEHLFLTFDQWQKAIFSDDSHFCSYGIQASRHDDFRLTSSVPRVLSVTEGSSKSNGQRMHGRLWYRTSSNRGRNDESGNIHCNILSSFKMTMHHPIEQKLRRRSLIGQLTTAFDRVIDIAVRCKK